MRLVLAWVAVLLAGASAGHAQPNPSFTLVNRGSQPIVEAYATATGFDRWGPDRLARYSLPAGMTYPVRLPADGTCIYDIRVVYADGRPEERRQVNTCQVDSVAFPGGRTAAAMGGGSTEPGTPTDDPSFRLVNRGRTEVSSVFASPTGEEDWGQDRLGDDTVEPGQTRVIRLPRGQCTYDVRVVFANNEATEKRRLNLCTITDLRVP